MTDFIQRKFPKFIIDNHFTLVILIASFLLCKYVFISYWQEDTAMIHTIFDLICVFIMLGIFFLYWLSSNTNQLYTNILPFGFLAITISSIFHITTFLKIGVIGYNSYILYLHYDNLSLIYQALVILIMAFNPNIKVKSKKLSLIFTLVLSGLLVFILGKIDLYIPCIHIQKYGINPNKLIIEIFSIIICIISIIHLVLKFNRSKINSYKIMNKGIIFYLISSIAFICFSDQNSFYALWDHFLKVAFYCYIFSSFFSGVVIYPYDIIHKMYNESEQRFRSAFDKLMSGVLLTDFKGKSIKANENCMRMLGYLKDEFDQFNIEDILPNEKVTLNIDYIVAILENYRDKIITYDKCYKDARGNEVWLKVNISVTDDLSGNPLYLMFELQDNSSIRKVIELESDIEQKGKIIQETQELDRLRIEFFSNLSHELRTPLNVISGALQLFELNLKDNMNDKMERNINYMKQNCRRMLRLVNNLLDTTQIESGFYKLKLKNINIVNLVEDIALSVSDYMKQKNIELIFDTDVEEKIIPCDPDKMERIILNLLSNAIKFTKSGGKVFIDMFDKDDEIMITVKDTGIGIPEDKQKLVFERFRQVDKSLVKNQEGSGIGLALTKSLIDLHGGSIKLKSKLGVGSEFIIKLPVIENQVDVVEEENKYYNDRVERVRVEFSDIYIS